MNYTFTPDQAKHAQAVAMMLWRKRCFLPRNVDRFNSLPNLHIGIFQTLYLQNDRLVNFYEDTARNTRAHLLHEEKWMRLDRPHLRDGQEVADTNLYGSGLDIVAIVPMSALTGIFPHNESEMADQLLDAHYPVMKRGDITPNQLEATRNTFLDYAHKVYREHWEEYESKVLVVLETRFTPSRDRDDFLQTKVDGLIYSPYTLSWLLYSHALKGGKLTDKPLITTNNVRQFHPVLFWDKEKPRLETDRSAPYSGPVAHALIL